MGEQDSCAASGFNNRCGRENPALTAATSERGLVANGRAIVFGFCSVAPRSEPERKIPKSMAGRTDSVGASDQDMRSLKLAFDSMCAQ